MENTYKEHHNPAYDDTPVVVSQEEANKAAAQAAQNQIYPVPAYGAQGGYGQPAGQPQGQYGYANPQEMPIAVQPKKTFGMKRKTLLLIIASIVLLAGVIGAAAAAGVLASQKKTAEEKLADATRSPQSSTSGSSGDSSAATTNEIGQLAKFTVQSDWGGFNQSCPSSGGSTYTVPGTTLKFRRECNTNYPGADLARVPMSTMEDCIKFCAMMYKFPQSANGRCLMVNWIYKDLQGTNDSWCWLKFGKPSGGAFANAETAYIVDDDGKYIGDDAKYATDVSE